MIFLESRLTSCSPRKTPEWIEEFLELSKRVLRNPHKSGEELVTMMLLPYPIVDRGPEYLTVLVLKCTGRIKTWLLGV